MKKLIGAVLFVSAASLLCMSYGHAAETNRADKYGGIYSLRIKAGPGSPIGYPAEAGPDALEYSLPALEALFRVKVGGVIEPLLATSYKVSADGSYCDLHLRQGVKFHDGTDFDAEAVKWNLDTMIQKKRAKDLKSIDVIDKYTVRLHLISVFSNTTLSELENTGRIISPTAVEKNGVEWARWHPVGVGPFKFVKYIRDSKIVYERNENYWRQGLPYLDGIEINVIADDTVSKMAFESGKITSLRATGNVANELKTKGYEYITRGGGSYVLIPDSGNPDSPLANKTVRLAISYALNRDGIAKALGFGFANPAYQLFPGFSLTKIPNLDKHEYNPQKAKELLAKAGYPNGFEINCHVFGTQVPRDYIMAIANMLGEIGLKVITDFPDRGRYSELRFGGWKNGFMAHAMASKANLNAAFTMYLAPPAFPSLKKTDTFDDLLAASLSTKVADPEAIQALVQYIHDEAIVIPYAEEIAIAFFQKGVHDTGILDDELGTWTPEIAWIEPQLQVKQKN